MLKGRRIVSNEELETKRRARENVSDENGRREGERKTFTKTPGTGLVKETIPAGAEKLDVRAPRESGGEDNAQTPVLLNQEARERHRGEHNSQGCRAEDRRPQWRIWFGQHQKEKRQRTPQACTASRAN